MTADLAVSNSIKGEVMLVTPALAREWLARNTHNRVLRRYVVTKLAGAIARGEYFLNGEAIKLAVDGTLIDGQHRLAAIIEADEPVPSFVVTGLMPEARETIDVGVKRTTGDMLSMRGVTNCNQKAAVVSLVISYDDQVLPNKNPDITAQRVITAYEANMKEFGNSVHMAALVWKNIHVSRTMLGALHYIVTQVDDEDGGHFFNRLESGIEIPAYSSILTYRTLLQRESYISSHDRRYSTIMLLAFGIKAWNAFRQDQPLEHIKYIATGPKAEPYPIAA
jgi:hypothetical protein